MTHEAIMEKLAAIMQNSTQAQVDWSGVGPDSLIADMGFDSLAILDLIYDLQQAFGIEFDAEEMTHIRTVGALAQFIKEKSG